MHKSRIARAKAYLQVLKPLDIDNQLCAVFCQSEQVNIPNPLLFFLHIPAVLLCSTARGSMQWNSCVLAASTCQEMCEACRGLDGVPAMQFANSAPPLTRGNNCKDPKKPDCTLSAVYASQQ